MVVFSVSDRQTHENAENFLCANDLSTQGALVLALAASAEFYRCFFHYARSPMKPMKLALCLFLVAPIAGLGVPVNGAWMQDDSNPVKLPIAERSFKLGVVPMPQGWSSEKIAAAHELSAQIGEVVSLSQKLGWTSAAHLLRYKNDVSLARKNGQEVFVSVELFEANRKEIGNLPDVLKGKNFLDVTLRQCYLKEVTEIAERYRPEYLDLAVEANGYFQSHPQDFLNFVSLYKEAVRSVKSISPATQVSVSFQYEAVVSESQWDLIGMFGGQLDMLFLTTYPEFLYGGSVDRISKDHYSVLKNIGDLPIVFTEIGWSGGGRRDREQQQAEFMKRFVELTADTKLELGVWSLLHDWKGGGVFETMGLIDVGGRKKRAWTVARALRDLPLKR